MDERTQRPASEDLAEERVPDALLIGAFICFLHREGRAMRLTKGEFEDVAKLYSGISVKLVDAGEPKLGLEFGLIPKKAGVPD